MNITHMSHNILYEIFKYLDIKSIRNLYNSTKIFRLNNNELFKINCGITVKSLNELLEVKNKYPKLRVLKIDFNEELKNSLNIFTELEILIFGDKFNKRLYNNLHYLVKLRELYFGHDFNQDLTNYDNNFNQCLYGLPIEKLVFGHNFNQEITRIVFRNGVYIFREVKTCINIIQLKEIIFGDNFNQWLYYGIEKKINVKKIILGKNYDQNYISYLLLAHYFPNLEEIKFGENFNRKICDCKSIIGIGKIINYANIHEIDGIHRLSKLKKIYFGNNFKQDISCGCLKYVNCLEEVSLPSHYSKQKNKISIKSYTNNFIKQIYITCISIILNNISRSSNENIYNFLNRLKIYLNDDGDILDDNLIKKLIIRENKNKYTYLYIPFICISLIILIIYFK